VVPQGLEKLFYIEFPFVKSEQYIAGFLSKLRQDRLLIFLAAKEAQKAVNYILNYRSETEGS
jgi:antirestriction protein ArdC